MHVRSFRIRNFRRLTDVVVDLDDRTTIFVGANNSGKTSATHVFQLFLGDSKGLFTIYDFSSVCWAELNAAGAAGSIDALPKIELDLWFEVDEENVHRVADFLPSLEWDGEPVGLRLSFQPKDAVVLMQNYADALGKAQKLIEGRETSYKPWPENLSDYLKKRLTAEYEIVYSVLTAVRGVGAQVGPEQPPLVLGNAASGAAKRVDSLIRVDFLDAQRNLSDGETKGRHENLSRRLSKYYTRNLEKQEADLEALSALAESENKLNEHFDDAFSSVLGSLTELGYPGVGNYELVVKADFNASSILSSNANVHYALPTADAAVGSTATLPDRYNGLGFKNLIYMAVEILDFNHAWREAEEERPPVHLVIVEEPESHLHAQLQQVFIRQISKLVPDHDEGFQMQMVVTTHSSHIIYEDSFRAIRYFRRTTDPDGIHSSEVRNLSKFYDAEDVEVRQFLAQYMKLTHCDLFFADAVVLVEGNVERLLLPMMIDKDFASLRACHLTILEVGGAYGHKFDNLIHFLGVPALVVTDIDSVLPATGARGGTQIELFGDEHDKEEEGGGNGKRCMTSASGAITSNVTLKNWVPNLTRIDELLQMGASGKIARDREGHDRRVRVAYQTLVHVSWGGEDRKLAGRTLEEAFALENLAWCQDVARTHLGLRIRGNERLDIDKLHERIYERVSTLDKTSFALGLITSEPTDWNTPIYIQEGLAWLEGVVTPPVSANENPGAAQDGEEP